MTRVGVHFFITFITLCYNDAKYSTPEDFQLNETRSKTTQTMVAKTIHHPHQATLLPTIYHQGAAINTERQLQKTRCGESQ